MKTAVVILNYNGAEHLKRFLPEVIKTTSDADIVVADNGSTDNSLSILESYSDVKVIELDKNYGFAEGYNRALALLDDYDFYVLLNSDIKPSEGWLQPLVNLLAEDSTVAAVAPKILSIDSPNSFEYAGASGGFIDFFGYPFCRGRILQALERDEGQYNDRREVFWVSGAAFCVRKSAYRSLGGLCSEFFAHMEEIDLCWRMQLAGWKVMVEPKSSVWHLGGGTLSSNSPYKIMLNHRNNLAMLFRCAPPFQRAVVAVVRPILDFAAALSYIAGGNMAGAKAVVKAWRDFIAWHKRLSAERRVIRGSVKRESKYIYKGMIVALYFMGRRKFGKMI